MLPLHRLFPLPECSSRTQAKRDPSASSQVLLLWGCTPGSGLYAGRCLVASSLPRRGSLCKREGSGALRKAGSHSRSQGQIHARAGTPQAGHPSPRQAASPGVKCRPQYVLPFWRQREAASAIRPGLLERKEEGSGDEHLGAGGSSPAGQQFSFRGVSSTETFPGDPQS